MFLMIVYVLHPFFEIFSSINCALFFIDFGIDFDSMFDVVLLPFRSRTQLAKPSKAIVFIMNLNDLHHLFRASVLHWFCIDFGMDFRIIFYLISWYLYRSCTQPAKPSQTIVFTLIFKDFTIHENMIFDDVHDRFRYQFWHCFLIGLGIDFGSIVAPLWHLIQCFGVIVLGDDFWNGILVGFDQKGTQILKTVHPFSLLFRPCFAGDVFEGSVALPFGSIWFVLGTLFDPFSLFVLFIFSKNIFLSTQDRESTVDSRWHPPQTNPRRSTSSF